MSSKVAMARGHAVLGLLRERFPRVFAPFDGVSIPRPLAIGIHEQIQSACHEIAARDLRHALWIYCGRNRYLKATVEGAERIGLDGAAAGVVTAEEHVGAQASRLSVKAARVAKQTRRAKQAPQSLAPTIEPLVAPARPTLLLPRRRDTGRPVIVEVFKRRRVMSVPR